MKKNNIDGSKLIRDDKFISWLEMYTMDSPLFFYNASAYKLNRNDKKNFNNIAFLEIFYMIVNEYAENNYICMTPSAFGKCYQISNNNIGYEIGKIVDKNIIFYCKRTDVKDGFISYDDIKNNRKQDNVDIIEEKLEILSNLIETMVNDNIPVQLIADNAEKTFKRILRK